ncbi:hypothetical protein KIPB_015817, partial [Kipferlia bialata]
ERELDRLAPMLQHTWGHFANSGGVPGGLGVPMMRQVEPLVAVGPISPCLSPVISRKNSPQKPSPLKSHMNVSFDEPVERERGGEREREQKEEMVMLEALPPLATRAGREREARRRGPKGAGKGRDVKRVLSAQRTVKD